MVNDRVELSCPDSSIQHGQPLVPQASAASGWIMLEHHGPWGPDLAEKNDLVPAALRAAIEERNLRFNLVRRHRRRPGGQPSTCFLASCASANPFVERLLLSDPCELIGPALDALAEGQPSGLGTSVTRPLYLVCTHGRKNPSCARLGRPIAQAVTSLVGARAWEATHVGGCQFAANLVCLPAGVYYGRINPEDVTTLIALAEAGRIALPWFRGRVGAPEYAQVAEALLRRLTTLDAVDAIRPIDGRNNAYSISRNALQSTSDAELYQVELASDCGHYRVLLCGRLPDVRELTSSGDLVDGYQVISVIKLNRH